MSNEFRRIDVESLGNAQRLIGKDWMIICAADESKESGASGMTASWGCLGVLWNKPVCVCFVRPQRYTFGLCEKNERMSFNFFTDGRERAMLGYFGKASGRDEDKIKQKGLTVAKSTPDGAPFLADADVVILGRKIYEGMIEESGFVDKSLLDNYKMKDYHKVYVCEIEEVMEK